MTRTRLGQRSRPIQYRARLQLVSLEARDVPDGSSLGDLGFDSAANLSFCALPPSPKPPPKTGSGNQPQHDVGDTFHLHSHSSSSHVIYLDFDGNATQGTPWNSTHSTIVTPNFDTDGDPTTFTDAEYQTIQVIWQRVSEDFSPFDVDVTTAEPSSSQLRNAGIRVNIGGDGSWSGGNYGGIAYLNVFGNGTDTGCFVFSDNLGGGYPKYVGDAISHEVGHTLGLTHDGRTLPSGPEEYFGGSGTGPTSWGPIMGDPYGVELTQWSKGEYKYANNKEDDLSIITSQNGFGYRPDDHGNTIPTATAATLTGLTVISGSGFIERSADVDAFSFDTGTGQISLDVLPADLGANLDILAQLYDGAHKLIASSNPADALSASITTNVTAGQYFLTIEGAGKGDPLNGGYTDYDSLGAYSFTGNIVEPPPQEPVQVTGITATESRGGVATGFRLTFNVAPDPKTLRTKDLSVTGPTGLPVPILAVRAVPNTVTVFDVLIRPQRFVDTGGVRVFVPPTVAGARGGKQMDQDGNGTPGEATDYFAAATFRFNGSTGVIPDDGNATDFPLTIPTSRAWNIRDLNVSVNLMHSAVGQLQVSLVSPSNVIIPLILNRGGLGNNLSYTLFDDQATRNLPTAAAPFAGFFQPDGTLTSLNGSDAAGVWNLRITDNKAGDTGKLVSWDLVFATDDLRTFPTVTSVTPINETGSSLAERLTGVIVSFDRSMNPLTLARRDFRVIDPAGHALAVRSVTSIDAPANTQFRVVTALWAKEGQYTVKLGTLAADTYGNDPDPSGNGRFSDLLDVSSTTHIVARNVFVSRQTNRTVPRGRSLTTAVAVGPSLNINELAVELNIAHASVGDLKVTLIAPDGTEIVLVANEGGAGANFTHTIFSTAATTSIVGAAAPFTGDFKAEDETGMAGLVGKAARGTWKLKIEDTGTGENGKLLSWGLFVG